MSCGSGGATDYLQEARLAVAAAEERRKCELGCSEAGIPTSAGGGVRARRFKAGFHPGAIF